jgi:hypothetical protein
VIGWFIYISGAQTFYEAGQLLSSALLAGHIECFLVFCYNELALAIKTTLQNKLSLGYIMVENINNTHA